MRRPRPTSNDSIPCSSSSELHPDVFAPADQVHTQPAPTASLNTSAERWRAVAPPSSTKPCGGCLQGARAAPVQHCSKHVRGVEQRQLVVSDQAWLSAHFGFRISVTHAKQTASAMQAATN